VRRKTHDWWAARKGRREGMTQGTTTRDRKDRSPVRNKDETGKGGSKRAYSRRDGDYPKKRKGVDVTEKRKERKRAGLPRGVSQTSQTGVEGERPTDKEKSSGITAPALRGWSLWLEKNRGRFAPLCILLMKYPWRKWKGKERKRGES